MTREEIKMLASEVSEIMQKVAYPEYSDPLESAGYYELTSCTAKNGAHLAGFAEISLTRLNGHMCFVIYHGADVDSCECMCDPDWAYTADCSAEELEKALLDIADAYTEEKLLAMYPAE